MPWISSKNTRIWKSWFQNILSHASLLNDLLIEDLVTLGNLLPTKFMKPQKWPYVTSSKQAWVPQEFKNKVLKHLLNNRMIRLAVKPWNMYDNKKQQHVDKWRKNQNPIVCIKLWFNRHVNMNICSKYVISKGNLQLWKEKQSQPNGPIKTKGCHVRFKCRNWVDNYKYVTNPPCSQTWVICAFN